MIMAADQDSAFFAVSERGSRRAVVPTVVTPVRVD
jgi:hypothetical protein